MLNLFVQKQPKTGELVSTVEKYFSMTLVRKTEAIYVFKECMVVIERIQDFHNHLKV